MAGKAARVAVERCGSTRDTTEVRSRNHYLTRHTCPDDLSRHSFSVRGSIGGGIFARESHESREPDVRDQKSDVRNFASIRVFRGRF